MALTLKATEGVVKLVIVCMTRLNSANEVNFATLGCVRGWFKSLRLSKVLIAASKSSV
jgi:hypothetical protein